MPLQHYSHRITDQAPLKAGAAKIDITPAEDAFPKNGFKRGIRDRINVRAIVVDNGINSAALVSADVGGVPSYMYLALYTAN